MSIDQKDVVDFVALDEKKGVVYLIAVDQLNWIDSVSDHLLMMQNKLNYYLEYAIGESLYKDFPNARNKNIIIKIVGKFQLRGEGSKLFRLCREAIKKEGFDLQFELFRSND